MNQKKLLYFISLFFISLGMVPYSSMAQRGTLSSCQWLEAAPIAPGDSLTWQIDWSCQGSGVLPQSITLTGPTGTDGGWDTSTFQLLGTDMPGTWSLLQYPSGGLKLNYTGPNVQDGQYASFSIKCRHDGIADTVNSNVVNVQPGSAYCYIKIPVSFPLPISLTSFDAIGLGNKTQLQWVTASEQNSSHYEVEASIDGDNFEKIASVDSKADEYGNSNQTLTYNYTDEAAASRAEKIYYRLKQVDLNGEYSYTDVLMVDFGSAKSSTIASPNPVHIGESISVLGEDFRHVQLFDAIGQTVYSRDYSTAVHSAVIPTQDLSPGLYYLMLDGKEKISVLVQ